MAKKLFYDDVNVALDKAAQVICRFLKQDLKERFSGEMDTIYGNRICVRANTLMYKHKGCTEGLCMADEMSSSKVIEVFEEYRLTDAIREQEKDAYGRGYGQSSKDAEEMERWRRNPGK